MSETAKKSPISVLDEFCKRKLQPPAEYVISSDIASEFICTVKSFNEKKTAKAKSKKKAKHAAAHELIKHLRTLESFKFDLKFLSDSIINLVDDTEVSSSTTGGKKRKNTSDSTQDINYIGNLLEFCTKNKLPPPSFESIEDNTPTQTQNNSHEFLMKCWVNDTERQGKGSSKKQAKKEAAMKVLNVLMETQTNSKIVSESGEPSPKRIKSSEATTLPEDNKSANAASSAKITPVSLKERVKINPFNYTYESSDYSDDDDSEDIISYDNDCDNEVNTGRFSPVQSESDSEQEPGNDWGLESDYDYFSNL